MSMIESFEMWVPQLHPTAWVHRGAWVIGDVVLGEEVSVWPTAVLRGDMGAVRVGRFSNVQDGVICHDTGGMSETDVGERCTIGHRAVLHGCRIGDDCLIGMAAVIMDNVVVGAGSIVGASALLTKGQVIPPRSLVLGSPAKVVRQVTEAESASVTAAWREYQAKQRAWRRRATKGFS